MAQSGKFIGKVVVKFREEDDTANAVPKMKIVRAHPSTFLVPEHSYIVTSLYIAAEFDFPSKSKLQVRNSSTSRVSPGGLCENGIQIVDWLITRGARKIVVQSLYKPVTGYQSLALRRWKDANINIVLSNADISSEDGATNLFKTASSLAAIGGIFHMGHVRSYLELLSYFVHCLIFKSRFYSLQFSKIASVKTDV